MPTYYYICPYELMYAIGGGQFSLSDPGGARPTRAARVMIYGTWDQARGTRCTTVKGGGQNGFGKSWCLARVQDEQPGLGLIDFVAVESDATCVRLPIGPDLLEREFGSFSQTVQDAVIARLESYRLPADLITDTMTVRQIIGYILRILFAAQQLGIDFPELDLAATWNTIPLAKRQRILAWAVAHGVNTSGLTGSTPIRTIIKRLLTAEWGAIVFGGETF